MQPKDTCCHPQSPNQHPGDWPHSAPTPHAVGSATWRQDLNWETEKEDGGGEGGGGEDAFGYRSQPYVGPAFTVKVCIFIST